MDRCKTDDLMTCGLKLRQPEDGYCFTTDAVLLANFVKVKRGDVLADFCSGSGVVPVLVCGKTNCVTRAFCVEIQPHMAEICRENAELNGMGELFEVICGSVQESVAYLSKQRVTAVTVNPPYRKADEGMFSDRQDIALSRCEIAVTLEEIAVCASRVLSTGGRFYMVHRADRSAEIMHALYGSRLVPKTMRFVRPKPEKPPHLVLIEAIKDGGDGVNVLPELIIAGSDGAPTAETERIYAETVKEEI